MERVETLINRLNEQLKNNAGANVLLVTAEMLVHELEEKNEISVQQQKSVSIIHPIAVKRENNTIENTANIPQTERLETITVFTERNDSVKTRIPSEETVEKKFISTPNIEEIPTYSYQQKELHEVNNAILNSVEPTLSDRLKTEKKELVSVLKDTPVKDLKKAIGINDRFVFVDELFRGDENMYERSIKTINSFSILPEAEYWIQRELKVKLGWDDGNETVQHFDQLVRRRFS